MMISVKCSNFLKCKNLLKVSDSPVTYNKELIYPKVQEAVWICDNCRKDKKAFKLARSSMMKRFGVELNARSSAA